MDTMVISALKMTTKGKARFRLDDGTEGFVEEVALAHFKKQGYHGIWAENWYWWTIMALLFWDVLYVKLPGVWSPEFGDDFPNQLQDMPLDLFEESFYSRRQGLIAARMAELTRSSDLCTVLASSYRQHYGKPCRPIENWQRWSLAELQEGVRRLPIGQLLAFMERLLQGFREYRRGLPDLFLWRDGEARFAEVKGPGDKLSEFQQHWIEWWEAQGIPVTLTEVSIPAGAKPPTARQKAKAVAQELGVSPLERKARLVVSFGNSSSQVYDQAVAHMQAQPDYQCEGEGKKAIHRASFSLTPPDDLVKILDLTRNWKSRRIEWNGEEMQQSDLWGPLNCYRDCLASGDPKGYCDNQPYSADKNPFGCRHIAIYSLLNGYYRDYGRVQGDVWLFSKDEMRRDLMEQMRKVRACPLLRPDVALAVIEQLPDSVNPETDRGWDWNSENKHDGVRKLKRGEQPYNTLAARKRLDKEYVIQVTVPNGRKASRKATKGAGCGSVLAIMVCLMVLTAILLS